MGCLMQYQSTAHTYCFFSLSETKVLKQPHKLFLWCGHTGGKALEGVHFFFSKGTDKMRFFLALSGRENSLVQTCECCIHFDFTFPSVHVTQRFVIQGLPILTLYQPMTSFGVVRFWPHVISWRNPF